MTKTGVQERMRHKRLQMFSYNLQLRIELNQPVGNEMLLQCLIQLVKGCFN